MTHFHLPLIKQAGKNPLIQPLRSHRQRVFRKMRDPQVFPTSQLILGSQRLRGCVMVRASCDARRRRCVWDANGSAPMFDCSIASNVTTSSYLQLLTANGRGDGHVPAAWLQGAHKKIILVLLFPSGFCQIGHFD